MAGMGGVYTGVMGPWRKEIYSSYYISKTIEELADPLLIWEGFVDEEIIDSPTIEFMIEGTSQTPSSPGRDTYKMRAPLHVPGAEVPFVEVTDLSVQHKTTEEIAIGVRFRERMRQFKTLDPVQRTLTRLSRWMAEQLNYETCYAMFGAFGVTNGGEMTSYMTNASSFGYNTTTGILCGALNAAKYWGTDGMDPLTDIEELRVNFKEQEGYNYTLTDIMVPPRLYSKLKLYLDNIDRDYQLTPFGGRDALSIPEVGSVRISEAGYTDGLPTNKIVGWDRNVKPATTYVLKDSESPYTSWSEDSRFMSHQWMEDATGDLFTKIFTDRRTILIEPKGAMVFQVAA